MDTAPLSGGLAEGGQAVFGPSPEKEALLYRLAQRCMQAADLNELGFVIANDTWQVLPYQQAAVLLHLPPLPRLITEYVP